MSFIVCFKFIDIKLIFLLTKRFIIHSDQKRGKKPRPLELRIIKGSLLNYTFFNEPTPEEKSRSPKLQKIQLRVGISLQA